MSVGLEDTPLIAHVVYRFDVGGLENGVANLINHLPSSSFRHAIIALTEATDFRRRIGRDDVEIISLHKPPGQTAKIYPQLFRLFRRLRPAIVHTRNLAALECVVPAWAAGVPLRIHGEHGREGDDFTGTRAKYRWIRRAYRPFVSHYVALSGELAEYLRSRVGVATPHLTQLCNGVDTHRFHPADARMSIAGCPFQSSEQWLVGTVGRMQTVKDQATLVRAFALAVGRDVDLRGRLRLLLVGDGPQFGEVRRCVEDCGIADLTWMPGRREDVADILRGLDCFVLPSQTEGISNVILEALASGLPVIATAVGGNPELIDAGHTGLLVPPSDPAAMAAAITEYATAPLLARTVGRNGRRAAEDRFGLDTMMCNYAALYGRLLRARTDTEKCVA
jgi:sugar transferase (PEP-CTERM/EpsH1 system associated)